MGIEYRMKMAQKVADRINEFIRVNPYINQETLDKFIKNTAKHFGLNNKYQPPEFKKDVENNNDNNPSGPQTADSGSS